MGVELQKNGKFRTVCEKCYRWSSEVFGWNASLDQAIHNGWVSLVIRSQRTQGGHYTYCPTCSKKITLSDL